MRVLGKYVSLMMDEDAIWTGGGGGKAWLGRSRISLVGLGSIC